MRKGATSQELFWGETGTRRREYITMRYASSRKRNPTKRDGGGETLQEGF